MLDVGDELADDLRDLLGAKRLQAHAREPLCARPRERFVHVLLGDGVAREVVVPRAHQHLAAIPRDLEQLRHVLGHVVEHESRHHLVEAVEARDQLALEQQQRERGAVGLGRPVAASGHDQGSDRFAVSTRRQVGEDRSRAWLLPSALTPLREQGRLASPKRAHDQRCLIGSLQPRVERLEADGLCFAVIHAHQHLRRRLIERAKLKLDGGVDHRAGPREALEQPIDRGVLFARVDPAQLVAARLRDPHDLRGVIPQPSGVFTLGVGQQDPSIILADTHEHSRAVEPVDAEHRGVEPALGTLE
ncbi:hypothetical protein ENSA7_73470 [Enhygromyxa salina]|uniref:Uncharacterized protein n=1 Tax=Enhygromyxa salina TaxID=215803 RepID=A0A2S9XS74_9BACT|nr:hypothetical protein ENSA7_73470 [Enhygromyxa salina]